MSYCTVCELYKINQKIYENDTRFVIENVEKEAFYQLIGTKYVARCKGCNCPYPINNKIIVQGD